MTQQHIVTTPANTGLGMSPKSAFDVCEANFTDLYSGAGSTSSPYSITPLTHAAGAQPFPATDNFEQVNGSGPDLTGSRFAGATPWTWLNQGAASVAQQDGCLVCIPDPATPRGNFLQQPVSGSTWTIQCQVSTYNIGTSDGGGIFVRNSANSKIILIQTDGLGTTLVQGLTNPTTFSTNLYASTGGSLNFNNDGYPVFFNISFDGTTLTFSYSISGIPGTFRTLATQAAATFLGAPPTHWGLCIGSLGTNTCRVCFDQFQQIA